ncbi:hypothetical protein P153DRAFT_393761 [Dothidotthia symphoricarpi CBS 119687]|uniref:GRF-type domain-containing protein n=1 Tax=Dothidotthia symphoricarpi CBS 119687 TaxID=1392245 RepID=A0A6A6ANU4_9PLEO|nr:uncharacterized protein P153DRAFT_393761 [Dothidotthia symphoricarpi CBS 119687]KAF2132808.1 hypothetical protein P153DRAFT_393761 [Dothidotthia symphoricarpi CBS 119687]
MSSSKRRGGLFVNGVWQCDCTPRKPTVHFEVKKEGPNKGKWFRSCQKQQTDTTRCKFFLWDADADKREAAGLANNSRTPSRVNPTTPSKRRSSPPPPYTVEAGPSGSSRKRTRAASEDLDDEYGLEQNDHAFNDALGRVLIAAETPNKAIKTSTFATPSTRRKLPWQTNQSATGSTGLQTPRTDRRAGDNPFNTRISMPSTITPSRLDEHNLNNHRPVMPSSPFDTPTPNRFKNVGGDDLVGDVLRLLQEANIGLDSDTTNDLKAILSKHSNSAEGYKRGRDVLRTTIKAKDAKITELTYRVSTLEAEMEAEKAVAKHMQWEAQTGSQSDL